MRCGADLLDDRQQVKLCELFADPATAPVEAAWDAYQTIIGAYRDPDHARGKQTFMKLIGKFRRAATNTVAELAQLGRALHRRGDGILAWFDHPRTTNGPTEAINGRLEHLKGTVLGFRNLTNYRL